MHKILPKGVARAGTTTEQPIEGEIALHEKNIRFFKAALRQEWKEVRRLTKVTTNGQGN